MIRTKNYTPVIILTFLILLIITYLFINVNQKTVECSNTYIFDYVKVTENITANFSGNKIGSMTLIKKIKLDGKYADEEHISYIKNALNRTLSYLNDVKYEIGNDYIVVTINATGDDVILLNNIEFSSNDDLTITIDSNIKSSNVITLTVGDSYTESEFMKRLKNSGYSCK